MSDSYRITGWDDYFENSASRKLKRLDWVAVPNKMDGSGYTALVDHPNGAAHLGAWYAIVEICSRQRIRGNIPNVGGTCRCLGRISRLPADLFSEVIPRLIEIGWIELYQQDTELPPASASTSAESGKSSALQGRERNRTEQKEQNGTELGAAADRMYRLHPKKKDLVLVPEALERSVARGNKLSEIEACHAAHAITAQWLQEGGRFCPSLAKWLEDDGFTAWPDGKRPVPKIDPSKMMPLDTYPVEKKA